MGYSVVICALFLLHVAGSSYVNAHCPYHIPSVLFSEVLSMSPSFDVTCSSKGAAIAWDTGGLPVQEINVHYSCISPNSTVTAGPGVTETLLRLAFSEATYLDPHSATLPAQYGSECAVFGCYEASYGQAFFTFQTHSCSWPPSPTAVSAMLSSIPPEMSHDSHMTTATAMLYTSSIPTMSHDDHMTSSLMMPSIAPTESASIYITTASHDNHVTSTVLQSAGVPSKVDVSPDGHVTTTEAALRVAVTTTSSAMETTSESVTTVSNDGALIVWAISAVVVVMVTIVAAFAVACCIVCQKRKRRLSRKRLWIASEYILDEDISIQYDGPDIVSVGNPHQSNSLSGSMTSIHTIIHKLFYSDEETKPSPNTVKRQQQQILDAIAKPLTNAIGCESFGLGNKDAPKSDGCLGEFGHTKLQESNTIEQETNNIDSGMGDCIDLSSSESFVDFPGVTHNADSGLTSDILRHAESRIQSQFPSRTLRHTSSDPLLSKTNTFLNTSSTSNSSRSKLSLLKFPSQTTDHLQPQFTHKTDPTCNHRATVCEDGTSRTGYVTENGLLRSQSATDLERAGQAAVVDIWRAESLSSQDSFIAVDDHD